MLSGDCLRNLPLDSKIVISPDLICLMRVLTTVIGDVNTVLCYDCDAVGMSGR